MKRMCDLLVDISSHHIPEPDVPQPPDRLKARTILFLIYFFKFTALSKSKKKKQPSDVILKQALLPPQSALMFLLISYYDRVQLNKIVKTLKFQFFSLLCWGKCVLAYLLSSSLGIFTELFSWHIY